MNENENKNDLPKKKIKILGTGLFEFIFLSILGLFFAFRFGCFLYLRHTEGYNPFSTYSVPDDNTILMVQEVIDNGK